MRSHRGLSAVSISALLLFASGCTTPVWNRPWVEVSSANFEILSTMSEEETVELAIELERFRALIFAVTRTPRSESPIPTRITAFSSNSDFRNISGTRGFVGFFRSRMRENQILISDWSNDLDASSIIKHEYIHFVLRNGRQVDYPLWYDEGFAEFLSTAKPRDEWMAIGLFPRARIASFKYGDWISLKTIISARSYSDFEREELHMFYAEAWALVHHLSIGRGGEASMADELRAYLDALELGERPATAFELAFGESLNRVERQIRKQLKNVDWPVVGIRLEELEYDRTPPRTRTPRQDEIDLRLGSLQLDRGTKGSYPAREHFARALAANPENARAAAGYGDTFKFEDRWGEAEKHLRRAVELDPEDPLNELDWAEFLHDRAVGTARGAERLRLLAEAREAYRRSLELDDSIPETWAMLGRTYLAAGEDASQSTQPLEHAHELLPGQSTLMYLLAESYVATGQEGRARGLLARNAAISERGATAQDLEKEIDAIKQRRRAAEASLEDDPPA